ncbi:S41 family peptidase [Paraglaciecola sp. 2405UD69-4]|uniref:S41 family peptidase n=1 Tax=Paraglaciecola sp. 2405UD69-4 TaxID=3391836 RepID=UPI0039C94C13
MTYFFSNIKALITLIVATTTFLSCGGNSSQSPDSDEPVWIAGQFLDESEYKDLCASPRTEPDSNGDTFDDVLGTLMHEKMWLRSWTNQTYLWYDEVEDNDPTSFTLNEYFEQLKTQELTESGSAKDNFHFSQATEEYNLRTQTGVSSGYGISWEFVSASSPRKLIVRYTEPNSPADLAGVKRGYELSEIDNIDVINADTESEIDAINAALFPSDSGQIFNFVFTDSSDNQYAIDLTSANVELQPVQNVKIINTQLGNIGYMQFNSFISAGQQGLIDGFQEFSDNSVSDLILDMRYNGGGLLAMASQLAYMIAGSSQTANETFETTLFNSKSGNTNPVTGNQVQATPFYTREINWDTYQFTDTSLPTIELSRVFILTTENTCSASEAVINGLNGIDVEVILIGDTTCGKPYGFYPQDNCSTTYFTIQFQGVNAKGFGDYADGFKPSISPSFEDELPGCVVTDDFTNELGEESEHLLATALNYTETSQCLTFLDASSSRSRAIAGSGVSIKSTSPMLDSIILENKLITDPISLPANHAL